MNSFVFALRRAMKSGVFPLLLILCAAAVFLASFPGVAGTQPPAGVCDLDGGEESGRVAASLTENGYLAFEDPEEMLELVERGELDCCVVLPEGLGEMIRAGTLDGAVRFVSSPSSFAPGLYRSHAAAALFRECAPYITAEAFSGTPVSEDEVLDAYFELFEQGYAFAFEITREDGTAASEDARARSLVMGAASILLFAVLLSSAPDMMTDGFRDIACRLGAGKTMRAVLLPSLAIRALCAAAAVSVGLLAAHFMGRGSDCLSLVLPVFLYAALLTAVGMLLSAVLPGKRQLHLLIPAILLLSLALCPICTDLSLLSPVLGTVRLILPTYWFWLIADDPLLWLLVTALAAPLSCAAMLLRLGLSGKFKIK